MCSQSFVGGTSSKSKGGSQRKTSMESLRLVAVVVLERSLGFGVSVFISLVTPHSSLSACRLSYRVFLAERAQVG